MPSPVGAPRRTDAQSYHLYGSARTQGTVGPPGSVTIEEKENLRQQLDTDTNILGALDMCAATPTAAPFPGVNSALAR